MRHNHRNSEPYLLDVTLRDGGYVNEHSWTMTDAADIAETVVKAGVSGVEVGYLRPDRRAVDGETRPSASCPEAYLDHLGSVIAGQGSLVVMAHQEDIVAGSYDKVAAHGVETVRLPTKVSGMPRLGEHVREIHNAGMSAIVNVVRVSELTTKEVQDIVASAHAAGADAIYLADSNGSLFPTQVGDLVRTARDLTDRPVGFHAHNGLSLAFINSVAALEAGASYIDASLAGVGKGGGNLSLELMVGYLKVYQGANLEARHLSKAPIAVQRQWPLDQETVTEAIASGLLNMNVDEVGTARNTGDGGLMQMLDSIERAKALPRDL